jgi:hypothetical protein
VTINMFEGARRIAKLIAVFIVVGFGIAFIGASSQTVYLEYPYLITAPGDMPILGTSCSEGAKQESVSITSRRGVDLRVRLCLLYATESRLTFDDLKFQIPESDENLLNVRWWLQTFKNAGIYFLGMLASLAGLWVFTWTVGWIVRGFVGASRLPDAKSDETGGAVPARWSPDRRLLMMVTLAIIVVGIFALVGVGLLEGVQKDRMATLAQAGQQEVMKVIEAKAEAEKVRKRAIPEVWEVQLGSYSDAGNVTLLVGKLNQLGIHTFLESKDTINGLRVGVRAGPFRTEEDAENASQRIRLLGISGLVVKRNM